MQSLWKDSEAANIGATWRSASTPRACSGATRRWCCTAAATPRSRCGERNLFGDEEEILYVKGSGWDLETIEAAGFSPVRLAHLLRACRARALSRSADGQRARTHMTRAVGARAVGRDDPARDAAAQVRRSHPRRRGGDGHQHRRRRAPHREIYGDKVVVIPYVMPGFDLARLCARAVSRSRPARTRSAWCCSITASFLSAPPRANRTSA